MSIKETNMPAESWGTRWRAQARCYVCSSVVSSVKEASKIKIKLQRTNMPESNGSLYSASGTINLKISWNV